MSRSDDPQQPIRFGPFTMIAAQRSLHRDAAPVRLGARAFDLLSALIGADGALVGQRSLCEAVWPGMIVEESALRVQIGTLRRALGDGKDGHRYIVNEAGRGYRFVAPLAYPTLPAHDEALHGDGAEPHGTTYVPGTIKRLFGRDRTLIRLTRRISERRLVTIVGMGGIGKTTLALAAAELSGATYDLPPLFIDLAPVADEASISIVLAALMGLRIVEGDPLDACLKELSGRSRLLILDNCEHLLTGATEVVEAILQGAPNVAIVATSREPLRADGEAIFRLAALDLPLGGTDTPTPEEARAFPAIGLLVDRATAASDRFAFLPRDVPFAIDIVRRLDGLPLAIELAAARLDLFGLEALAASLDDRFSILTNGRRTALPRQRTMKATIDWSYDMLDADEQALFRSLSVFHGAFLPGDAGALWPAVPQDLMVARLSDLAGKSLLTVESRGDTIRYRLLESLNAYGAVKLRENGEDRSVALAHAERCLAVLHDAEAAILDDSFPNARDRYRGYLNDIREAQHWAFRHGDPQLGSRIIAAAGPLWFQLTLLAEYRTMVERACAAIVGQAMATGIPGMQLLASLGHALWHTQGPRDGMLDAFTKLLKVSQDEAEPTYIRMAHWGLWNVTTLRGDYEKGYSHALAYAALDDAGGDGIVSQRIISRSLNFLGDQREAIRLARLVMEHSRSEPRIVDGLVFDERVVARAVLARAYWLIGADDDAIAESRVCVAEMRETGHALSVCYALAVAAIPVALWCGLNAEAGAWNVELQARSEEHGLMFWRRWAGVFDMALDARAGRGPVGVAGLGPMALEHLVTFGIDAAVVPLADRIARGVAGWCQPELLRHRALSEWRAGDVRGAMETLAEARTLAVETGAVAWELRIATTQAEVSADRDVDGSERRGH